MADAATLPKPKSRSRDLTQGPILTTLLMFSLPMLGSNILHAANSSINAVWVGRLMGEEALSATANGGLLNFFMLSGVFGLGMAVTIMAAQAMGRGDIDGVRRVAGTGWTLFALLGVTIGVLGWIFAPDLLRLMRTPEAAFPLALSYVRITFLGMPSLYLFIYTGMVMRGVGDSRTQFMFVLLTATIDVLLNPVLILGMFGLPRMGVEGSALALVIAQTIGGLGIVSFIYARDLPLRLRGAEFRYLCPDMALLRRIFVTGVPMGLQMTVMSLSALVMIFFVNDHGVTVTAAYGAVSQVWGYLQLPSLAAGVAISTMAAQNIGAGQWGRIEQITRSGIIINSVMTGAFVVVILLFERPIARLFLPNNEAGVDVISHINHVGSWGFVLFGVTMAYFSTVRAAGAVVAPLVLMTIALFPARIGFVLVAEPYLGAEAIWWSFPVGSAVMLALGYVYFRRGSWKKRVDQGASPSRPG